MHITQNILEKTNYYCKIGDLNSLKERLDTFDFTNNHIFDFITTAGIVGELNIVKYLIERYSFDVSTDDYAIFRWAVTNNRLNVAKYLSDNFIINPSARDNYALVYAIENKSLPAIKYLIEDLGVEFDDRAATALINNLCSNYMNVDMMMYFFLNPAVVKLIINNYMLNNKLNTRLTFTLMLKFGLETKKELEEYINAL